MQLVLSMSMKQNLSLKMESKFLTTCLPQAEAFLYSNLSIMRLLKKRLHGEDFESLMDAVLVCFLPDFEKPCQDYYEGKGKRLNEMVGKKKLAAIDAHLRNSLKVLENTYESILEKELWAKGKNHNVEAFDKALELIGWKS